MVRAEEQSFLDETIVHVAREHNLALDSLAASAKRSQKLLQDFSAHLDIDQINCDIAVVLFGSLARHDATPGSDCDYLVVVNGTPDPAKLKMVVAAVDEARESCHLARPGRTGTFGGFVTATELLEHIGLEGDSNSNTTRRLLLLTESVPVYNKDQIVQVSRMILERYLRDYLPEVRSVHKPIRVPRFLLNDLIRYWRTITVDFGAKQWDPIVGDWNLRYAKLRTTRKILFAGSLALMLQTENVLTPLYSNPGPNLDDEVWRKLNEHLYAGLRQSPLSRLMALYDHLGAEGREALAKILIAYDAFVGLLGSGPLRATLTHVGDGARDQVREIGDIIHDSLLTVFFADPYLARATRSFGVF